MSQQHLAWRRRMRRDQLPQVRTSMPASRTSSRSDGSRSPTVPDVVERVRAGASFDEPDPSSFYGGDEHRYTDSPTPKG